MNSLLTVRDQVRKFTNWSALTLVCALAFFAITPLFLIFGYLLYRGSAGINLAFFTEVPKPVGEAGGGMANAMLGSIILLAITSCIGVPIGIAGGIALSQMKRGLTRRALRLAVDLLTSVPSIVIGLFVYAVVVVPARGYSAWAGGIALAIVMVPMIARSSEEILRLVPKHIFEAGLALGLPRWRVIMQLVLPGARSGLLTGILLATARVSGETAPLLFTAFSNSFGFRGLSQPIASMPVQIFTFASSHDENWRNLAWTGALVLVGVVLVLNLLTRLFLSWDKSK